MDISSLTDEEGWESAWEALPTTPIPAVLDIDQIPTMKLPALDNQKQPLELYTDKIATIKLSSALARQPRQKQPFFLLFIGILIILSLSITSNTPSMPFSRYSLLPDMKQQIWVRKKAPDLPTPTPAPPNDMQEMADLGQRYLKALLSQQYNTMWSFFHPQLQAMWPNETSFANYCQARFQGFTLQHFTLGTAHNLSFWVNPETMVRYNNVEVLPVSLQLSAQVLPNKLAQLPPADQNPSALFSNLPLIAQRTTINSTTQWLILDGGPADPEAPILPPLTPVSKKIPVPIIMYHHINDTPTHNLLDFSLTITSHNFAQQLNYLKQSGYHTITFNQLFDALYYDNPLPSKPILLTFDDGYDDAYTFAYPILLAHGYSGMFYIITGKVGWKGQASWDQLREMLANGMQMGAHTVTHRNIGDVWLYSRSQAQQELQQSQQTMETQLGIPIQQFCYPAGEPFRHGKPFVQQAIINLLQNNGYIGATTDPPPVGTMQDSQEPFVLLRIRADGRETLPWFIKSLP